MSIHQEATIPASPDRVYEALTQSAAFTKLTGGRPAEIGGDGAPFTLFGGMITGRNVELVAGKMIVQAWRTKMWSPGEYSIVRFTLAPEGKGTKLVLDHTGYPADQHEHLSAGWGANYFEPLATHFTT